MRARWALAGTVLIAFVAYGSLAAIATTPRAFYDELLYMEAADSLASGDGLEVRGEPYERGVLYPVVVAPLLWAAPDREVGYLLAKLLNALLFALAAIPVYLLARRLLPRRHSVVVAALAVAIPSSVYVSVFMTESLAYLTACWAILAIVLAVERPTLAHQGAALLAIALAFLTRAQFAAFYAAYLLALAIALWLLPDRRTRLRPSLRALWPTAASLVLAFGLLVVLPAIRGDAALGSFGEYERTAPSPDAVEVVKWLVYHLAGLDLYLAVVPFAVAPIVLASWLARARRGSERHASVLASFVAINAAALLVVALVVGGYKGTGLGIDRLHDRYLFYVVPLWLVLLAAWAAEGAPKPRRVALIGGVAALVLTLALPYGELDIEDGVKLLSAVGSAFPAAVVELAGSAAVARFVVVVLAALLLAAVLLRPGRRARIAVAAVLAVFLFDGMLVWARAFNPREEAVFAGSLEKRWVDERVGDGSVAILSTPCEEGVLARDGLTLTEFYNSSIGSVVEIGGEFPTGRVGSEGQILDDDGRPLEADYAVAQPGVMLDGDRVADGTNAGLVLWHVGDPVRVPGATSEEDLTREACG